MSIIQRPNFTATVNSMMELISNKVNNIFKDYYIKRIIELGLATKIFSYRFELGYNGTSAHRKSITKIKSIIRNSIFKKNPFMEFTELGYINSESGDEITLDLIKTNFVVGLPKHNSKYFLQQIAETYGETGEVYQRAKTPTLSLLLDSQAIKNMFTNSMYEYASTFRYFKYLNYLFRKNNIPVEAITLVILNVHPGGDYTFDLSVRFSFVKWECITGDEIQRYIKVQSKENLDDELFSNVNYWRNGTLGLSTILDSRDPFDKYHYSKLFLHMDKVLKVLTTLNRKVKYEYHAFDFRTV